MTPTWHGRGSRTMPSVFASRPLRASPAHQGAGRVVRPLSARTTPRPAARHLSSRSTLSGVGARTLDNQNPDNAQGPLTPDTQPVGWPLSVSSNCQSANPAGASGCHGQ
jgi:hypothetical protein